MVSTAFMQALARIEAFDAERGTFAAWLFTIARNLIKMRYRHPREVDISTVQERVDGGETPPETVLRWEQAASIRAAVWHLTPEHRDVLTLRYLAELPFADVARQLGKSEGATKMLAKRGLEALRRQARWNEVE